MLCKIPVCLIKNVLDVAFVTTFRGIQYCMKWKTKQSIIMFRK